MSASNFDAIRKKYNLRQVSVSTWRDPKLSVLPARGGPASPLIAASAAGEPYTPTYKVSYRKLPEPTDDEESEEESEEEEGDEEANVEESTTTAATEEVVDAPVGSVADVPLPGVSEPGLDLSPATDTTPIAEVKQEVPESIGNDINTPEIEGEVLNVIDGSPSVPSPPPLEEAMVEVALVETTDLVDSVEILKPPPPAPSPPPPEESGYTAPVDVTTEPSVSPTGDEHQQDTACHDQAEPHTEEGSAAVEALGESHDATEAVMEDTPSTPLPSSENEDRRVTFAPGTPEPRPTYRKKKHTKGTKSMSNKKAIASAEESPDDIVAIVDADGVPEVASIPPVTLPSGAEVEHPADSVLEEGVADPPKSDDTDHIKAVPSPVDEDADSHDPPKDDKADHVEEPVTGNTSIGDDTALKRNKKKGKTSGSSRVKAKSASKSRSKEDTSPAAGLGIDVPPMPVSAVDDVPLVAPPPPTPPPGFDIFDIVNSMLPSEDANDEHFQEAAHDSGAVEVHDNDDQTSDPASQQQEIPPTPTAEVEQSAEHEAPAADVHEDIISSMKTEAISVGEDGSARHESKSVGDEADAVSVVSTSASSPGNIFVTPTVDDKGVPDDALGCKTSDQDTLHGAGSAVIAPEEVSQSGPTDETAEDLVRTDSEEDAVDAELANKFDPDSVKEGLEKEPSSTSERLVDTTKEPQPAEQQAEKENDLPSVEPQIDVEADDAKDGEAKDEDNVDGPETAELVSPNDNDANRDVPEPHNPMEDTKQETAGEADSNSAVDDISAEGALVSQNATDETVEPPSVLVPGLVPAEVDDKPGTVDDEVKKGEDASEAKTVSVAEEAAVDHEERIGDTSAAMCQDFTPVEGDQVMGDEMREAVQTTAEPTEVNADAQPVLSADTHTAERLTDSTASKQVESQKEQSPLDHAPSVEQATEPTSEPLIGPDNSQESELDPVIVASPSASIQSKAEQPSATPSGSHEQAPEPVVEAPPSPTLSKGSTHKHHADHWERKMPAKPHVASNGKSPEKNVATKQSNRHSREDPRTRERSHKSQRHSTSADEDAERRKRREARKTAEAARIAEEERKMAYEEELRVIRHEARRAARKAAAEEAAKVAKEEKEAKLARAESEAVARSEAEARRRKREREAEAAARPRRERRGSFTIPPLFSRSNSEQVRSSKEHRSSRGSRHDHDERPASRREPSPKKPDLQTGTISETRPASDSQPEKKDAQDAPEPDNPTASSSRGSRPHRKHHRDAPSDRPKTDRSNSERRSRRPVIEERPRSFFGSLLRGF